MVNKQYKFVMFLLNIIKYILTVNSASILSLFVTITLLIPISLYKYNSVFLCFYYSLLHLHLFRFTSCSDILLVILWCVALFYGEKTLHFPRPKKTLSENSIKILFYNKKSWQKL